MEVIAEPTKHVTGLARRRGGSGDPSPWTALGVEAAIRVTLRARVRHARPRRAARSPWSALGHVGGRAGASCSPSGGAELVVADIDRASASSPTRLGRALDRPGVGAHRRRRRPRALRARRRARRRVRARAALPLVAGAANNQLADDAVADAARRPRDPLGARLRRQRRRHHQHRRRARARGLRPRPRRARVRAIGDTMRTIFDHADATGTHAAARPRWSSPAGAVAGGRAPRPCGRSTPPAGVPPRASLSQVRAQRDRRAGAAPRARRPRRRPAARRRSRRPPSSAATSRARGRARCAMYSSSFAAGSRPPGRGPGTARSRSSARRRASAVEVAAQRARSTNTLPSPSTASPVNAPRPATKARWSAAWPGVAITRKRPELVAVGERTSAARAPPAPARRAARAARARLGVVGMVVRERDPARAPAARPRPRPRRRARRARARDRRPSRIAPDEPGVRPSA